jgi:dihydroorotate dehydrogenase (NAD+) catalytic subunit
VAQDVNLEVKIGRAILATPLIGASGLLGYGDEYDGLLDYASFGAIVTKTVTLKPRQGNPPPRIADVGFGIINSIGLENVGSRVFLEEILPELDIPCKLFVSIGGETAEEYRELAGLFGKSGEIDAIEVNISCPNVARGGIAFGSDPESTYRVVEGVRMETSMTVVVKIPPLVAGEEDVCRAACDAGADALTVANTYPALAIDIDRARPVLGGVTGGLSGRAIKAISLALVWKAARIAGVPVIGAGGIETADDAAEFILAGASAFQVGSIVLADLRAPSAIVAGLKDYMDEKGYGSLEDFKGKAAGEEDKGGKGRDSDNPRS